MTGLQQSADGNKFQHCGKPRSLCATSASLLIMHMKCLLPTIIATLFFYSAIGQNKLNGTWTVFAISTIDGKMYFNLDKDSLFVATPTNKSEDQEKLKSDLKQAVSDMHFEFLNNGFYNLTRDTTSLGKGSYVISEKQKTVTFIIKSEQGYAHNFMTDYKIKNGKLLIKYKIEGQSMKLFLKR